MPGSFTRNPVWAVYNEWRTARLNVKCLQYELRHLKIWNKFNNGLIAVTGSSSIGGLSFFQDATGKLVWQILGGCAVILGALKPVLKLSESVAKKTKMLAGYQVLDHDLHCVAIGIGDRAAYDDTAKKEFRSALKRKEKLIDQSDGSKPRRSVIRKLQAEVNEELPVDNFYTPK